MDHTEAIVLAIIEGLTEFVPVSSTGHMIITSSLMGVAQDDFTKLFTVSIQFGAILSVVALYRKQFVQSKRFYDKLFFGFIPTIVFGIWLSKKIDVLLESPVTVAISLLIGGFVLLKIDEWIINKPSKKRTHVTYFKAFLIGIFQCIAMIPGISRSAATIIGGMIQKLDRKTAAEFSFFLAVPTMFAATVKKMFDYYTKGYFQDIKETHHPFRLCDLIIAVEHNISLEEVKLLLIGNAIAFVFGILAIRSFVAYLSKNNFKLFGYYRIVLGLILLIIHFLIKPLNTF
ncbi:MAG: undecaprenyl-diphosphate phosphatase [Flavobacteriales bacterium AspAUS03]